MRQRWIFLSHPVRQEMPTYGGGDKPIVEPVRSMAAGDTCNTARWTISNHCGTHIDAPRHFYQEGAAITDYPADFWVFEKAWWVNVAMQEGSTLVGVDGVPWDQIPEATELLIFKTGIETFIDQERYWKENPGFLPEVAEEARKRFPSLRAIGMDSLSVSSWQNRELGRVAHRAFLDPQRPLLLLENMCLVPLDDELRLQRVVVAPLRVQGADAGPCTVMAEVG